jgi:hypothetical protein
MTTEPTTPIMLRAYLFNTLSSAVASACPIDQDEADNYGFDLATADSLVKKLQPVDPASLQIVTVRLTGAEIDLATMAFQVGAEADESVPSEDYDLVYASLVRSSQIHEQEHPAGEES